MIFPITPYRHRQLKKFAREKLLEYRGARAAWYAAACALKAARAAAADRNRLRPLEDGAEDTLTTAWHAREAYFIALSRVDSRPVEVGAGWSANALARHRARHGRRS